MAVSGVFRLISFMLQNTWITREIINTIAAAAIPFKKCFIILSPSKTGKYFLQHRIYQRKRQFFQKSHKRLSSVSKCVFLTIKHAVIRHFRRAALDTGKQISYNQKSNQEIAKSKFKKEGLHDAIYRNAAVFFCAFPCHSQRVAQAHEPESVSGALHTAVGSRNACNAPGLYPLRAVWYPGGSLYFWIGLLPGNGCPECLYEHDWLCACCRDRRFCKIPFGYAVSHDFVKAAVFFSRCGSTSHFAVLCFYVVLRQGD